ncbi:MAG: alpha/beta hydrolase [Deltaproteobacteria bacterium]|nr:MAG: alpha/beta hydrolase [Deltaproteobacteria bacterium]
MPISWIYLICLIVLIGACSYLLYPRIEGFFVFFPESSFDRTPDELSLHYKEVYFNTADGERLHGWFFPQKKESSVILFCHGNAGNISHRLDNIMLLLEQGLQVFIFDYRGYGRSSGRPSEKGLYLDGLGAYDYLINTEHIPPTKIIPFGRSLGAAVAIEISLQRRARSIIMENAFTSIKEMARTIPLFYLFSFFLPAHYNNLERIGYITIPKLLIHGEEDEIVSFCMGEKLFRAAKASKYFYPIKDAGHNDTFIVGGRKYFETIAAFAYGSKI